MTKNGAVSEARREAMEIFHRLPPERLPMIVRLLTRLRDGMPIDEAKQLFWQEAADDGLLNIRTQPP